MRQYEPFFLFLSSCLLVSLFAHAQADFKDPTNPPTNSQWQPPTEVRAAAIDDIDERNATRPVETLGQAALKNIERGDFHEGLNTDAGLQVRVNGSPSFSIRGSQSSSRVLVLQDGVPLNFADGAGFNPLFIASESTGSVSILKGPQSSLFGRDAAAGMVEFRTQEFEAPTARLEGGSFATAGTFVGTPVWKSNDGSQRLQVSAFEEHTDGFRSRADEQTTRGAWLGWGHTQNLDWKTSGLIARQIGSQPGSTAPGLYAPTPFSLNNDGGYASAQLDWRAAHDWTVGSRTSFKELTQRSQFNVGSALSPSVTQQNALRQTFLIHHEGLEFFDDLSLEKFSADYYAGDKYLTINELGADYRFLINDKYLVQPAVRYVFDGDTLVPSLGVMWADENQWQYFASYAQGFRPASVNERYLQLPTYQGNPNLAPERSEEFDVGFERHWPQWFFHFEAFARTLENLIQAPPINGVERPVNSGTLQSSGFEVQGSYQPNDWLMTAKLGYLNSLNVTSNTPALLSPPVQGSVSVARQWGRLNVSAQETLWASFYDVTDNDVGQPVYVTLAGWAATDVFASYDLTEGDGRLAGKTVLKASALNILNQNYQLNVGYPEAGKRWLASVQTTF